MPYSKEIPVGPNGNLVLSEAEGIAKVTFNMSADAGGGDLAGFAKLNVAASAEVSAVQLAHAALHLLVEKYPSLAAAVALVEGIADSQIKQL